MITEAVHAIEQHAADLDALAASLLHALCGLSMPEDADTRGGESIEDRLIRVRDGLGRTLGTLGTLRSHVIEDLAVKAVSGVSINETQGMVVGYGRLPGR